MLRSSLEAAWVVDQLAAFSCLLPVLLPGMMIGGPLGMAVCHYYERRARYESYEPPLVTSW